MSERVFLNINVNRARGSGYYVRCAALREAIEKAERLLAVDVVGIAYDGSNTIELILDPPINHAKIIDGGEEE